MKKERILEDIEQNQVKVELIPSESLIKTKGDYIKLKFQIGESDFAEARLDIGKKPQSYTFKLDEIPFRTMDRKEVTVKIKKKTFFGLGREDVDEKKIKLAELG